MWVECYAVACDVATAAVVAEGETAASAEAVTVATAAAADGAASFSAAE